MTGNPYLLFSVVDILTALRVKLTAKFRKNNASNTSFGKEYFWCSSGTGTQDAFTRIEPLILGRGRSCSTWCYGTEILGHF